MSLAIAHLAGSSLTSAPAAAPAPASAQVQAPASPRGMFGLSLSTRAPYLIRTGPVPAPSPTPTTTVPAQTASASPSFTTTSTSPVTPPLNSATSTAPLAVPVGGSGQVKEESAAQRRASVPSSPAHMAKEEIWRDGLRTGFLSFSSTL